MTVELWHSIPCPYGMSVRIALAEKGVAFREHAIELGAKPPELLALNPKGTVPVLVADDWVLADSQEILSYLELRYPEPRLLPPGSERNDVLQFCERATAEIGRRLPKLRRGGPDEKAVAEVEVRLALAALDSEAPEQGFWYGAFSLADVTLACFLSRLPEAVRPSALGLSRLAAWQSRVHARPSVAQGIG